MDDWKALQLCVDSTSSVASQLEVLNLSSHYADHHNQGPLLPATLLQHATRLRNLCLCGICIDWTQLPLLPKLTKIEVTTNVPNDRPEWVDLIAALARMPALGFLSLGNTLWSDPSTSESSSSQLSALKHIVFCNTSLEAITTFLNRIEVSQDLKVFTAAEVRRYTDRDGFRDFFQAFMHLCQGCVPGSTISTLSG